MSVPHALEQPALRRHPLRSVRVQAAGGTYRVVAPQSSQAVLERSGAVASRAARGEHPYWADVWPASIALFRRLLRGPELAGEHAADVGCGIGLAGIAAGLRGAQVTFCDREPDALRFAAFNAAELGVERAATAVFDWERDPLPAGVTLLLLSDVAYQYRHVLPLLRACDAVLAAGGRVLCADPERPTANDLVKALLARGASVEWTAAEDPARGAGGVRCEIRIVELRGGGR